MQNFEDLDKSVRSRRTSGEDVTQGGKGWIWGVFEDEILVDGEEIFIGKEQLKR